MTRHLGILLAAAILTGCYTVPLTPNPALERPLGWRPLPIAVGIHYSPEFRAHTHKEWKNYDIRWDFPLGRASVPLLDRAFAILFESPRTLDRRPPLPAAAPAVAGAIEPVIEEFTFGVPMVVKTGTYRAAITYRFTLYSPSGERLGAWTVQGEGAKTVPVQLFESAHGPGEAADRAMEDAARKLISGFRQVPAVSAWLRHTGVRDTGPPPTLKAQPATPGTSMPPAPASIAEDNRVYPVSLRRQR